MKVKKRSVGKIRIIRIADSGAPVELRYGEEERKRERGGRARRIELIRPGARQGENPKNARRKEKSRARHWLESLSRFSVSRRYFPLPDGVHLCYRVERERERENIPGKNLEHTHKYTRVSFRTLYNRVNFIPQSSHLCSDKYSVFAATHNIFFLYKLENQIFLSLNQRKRLKYFKAIILEISPISGGESILSGQKRTLHAAATSWIL